jgi:phage-related protein
MPIGNGLEYVDSGEFDRLYSKDKWPNEIQLYGNDVDLASRFRIKFYTYSTMINNKEIRWIGSAYDDLLAFPTDSRRDAGFQLGKVQAGIDPSDWKPFDSAGAGTREIRIKDVTGIYRVMYVAKFEEAIYVLHCFQKKRQTTSQQDIDIAQARYRAIVNARKAKK